MSYVDASIKSIFVAAIFSNENPTGMFKLKRKQYSMQRKNMQ